MKKLQYILISIAFGICIGLWLGVNIGKGKALLSNPFVNTKQHLRTAGGHVIEESGKALEKSGAALKQRGEALLNKGSIANGTTDGIKQATPANDTANAPNSGQ